MFLYFWARQYQISTFSGITRIIKISDLIKHKSNRSRPAASWLEAKDPPRASGAKAEAEALCATALPPTIDKIRVAEAVIPERSGRNDCWSEGGDNTTVDENSAKCAAAERALRPVALEGSCWLEPPRPGLRVREGET